MENIKQSVSELYLASLEETLLNQATARKEARLLAAKARMAGAEADLLAAQKAVTSRVEAFEVLEKALEAARGAAAGSASILRGARKGVRKASRRVDLVAGNRHEGSTAQKALAAAWVKAEEATVVYHDRLDSTRQAEEAAYATYAQLQSARRALRAAAVARDHASYALYRAETAPVVVRMPVLACRAAARKADAAAVASRAELQLVIDQLSRAQAKAVSALHDFVRKHGKWVPAPMAEGFLSPGDRRTGVPDVWVMSDEDWDRYLVSHLVWLLDDWKNNPLAVAKVQAAIERVQATQEANRFAQGSFVLPGHCKAAATRLFNRAVVLAKQRGLATKALAAVPAPALPVHAPEKAWTPDLGMQLKPLTPYYPVREAVIPGFSKPPVPWVAQTKFAVTVRADVCKVAWVPTLPGACLSTDTAPEAAKRAVIQARKAWEADRCAANLRKLNSALAQAAHGDPLDAVGAPAKPVGRALVDSTRIEPVYEALRRNIHSLDSRLGRLLCAFALRGDDKKVVSRVTKAVTLLFGSLPSEVRDATYWGIQKAAAKQAFIALKSGALDATKRGWTERALVENARLFAAVCAARLDGEAFATAQANGLDPLDAVQEYQELATDLEGQFAFEGEEEVELEELDFSEGVCMDAADEDEDEDEGVDGDESLDQVVELLAAEGDRQIDSLLGYSAHWDELPAMFEKVKVASTEEAMKKAVSVATEAFESELLRDFL